MSLWHMRGDLKRDTLSYIPYKDRSSSLSSGDASQNILVGIRHVTNVITWPGIYELRSRDRINCQRSRDRAVCHVTSVIPYIAQGAATDQLSWLGCNPWQACHNPILNERYLILQNDESIKKMLPGISTMRRTRCRVNFNYSSSTLSP